MILLEVIFWLTDPMRPVAPGGIGEAARLHGQLMTLAGGVLVPLAVLLARYFKILSGQDWPREVDRRFWWHGHLALSYGAALLVVAGFAAVLQEMRLAEAGGHPGNLHGWIGWLTAILLIALLINGWQRGTRGGPGKPAPGTLGPLHGVAGDHYDMTARRRWFERTHKPLGYLLAGLLIAAIISGLWHAGAPRWMLVFLAGWWVMLLLLALRFERQGRCVDGYQATWGPSMAHPGNRIPELHWGSRRYTEEQFHRLPWVKPRATGGTRARQEKSPPTV